MGSELICHASTIQGNYFCDNPTESYRLPNITEEQVTMARGVLNSIEKNQDGPSYHEDDINPEIIQE